MIRSFAHKGLQRFFLSGNASGIKANHVNRLRLVLAMLDEARTPKDMSAPALRLHPLKGDRRGFWAVTVQANWRLVFRLEDGDAWEVDYMDYH